MSNTIVCRTVAEDRRLSTTARLFGVEFPRKLEPAVYGFAHLLCSRYAGGYWEFFTLDNGGFYMAPGTAAAFATSSPNGWDGELSADAFGICCCLYAYSNLSFDEGEFPETCAEQYHLLRDFAMDHAEAAAIWQCTD